MLALEPGIAIRSYNPIPEVQVHHSIGISYKQVFGRGYRGFNKFAITVTPIDVTLKPVQCGNQAPNVPERLYRRRIQARSQNQPEPAI